MENEEGCFYRRSDRQDPSFDKSVREILIFLRSGRENCLTNKMCGDKLISSDSMLLVLKNEALTIHKCKGYLCVLMPFFVL